LGGAGRKAAQLWQIFCPSMDLAGHFLRFERHALQRESVMNTNSSQPGLNVSEIKVACL
jgi:hypothetical protein